VAAGLGAVRSGTGVLKRRRTRKGFGGWAEKGKRPERRPGVGKLYLVKTQVKFKV